MSKVSFSAIVFVAFVTVMAVSSASAQQQPAPAAAKPAASTTPPPATQPDVVLNQLQPAPRAAEMALYRQAKAKSPDDVRKFLATRKYLRQLWVAFPDGKLDADKAPAPSDDVDFGMAVDFNEQLILFSVKLAAGTTESK